MAAIALQCKLNGKEIATLLCIPFSSLIWGYNQEMFYVVGSSPQYQAWNKMVYGCILNIKGMQSDYEAN